jgi:predicted DNA-binding transcriptional regulator AlpA
MLTAKKITNTGDEVQARLREKREREEQHRVWLDALLNERDLARITGLSVASVRRWRLLRQGPRYVKIGSRVRYRPEDIRTWLADCVSGGSQLESK